MENLVNTSQQQFELIARTGSYKKKIKGFEAQSLLAPRSPDGGNKLSLSFLCPGSSDDTPSSRVRGQEEVTSEVFIMTLARISWVWLVAADAREFWLYAGVQPSVW